MAAGIALDDRQRLDWLRLIRTESIGPRSFRSLMSRFGGAAAALDALPDLARQAGRPVTLCTPAEAERELAGLQRLGARLIALGEDAYPAPLQAIDSAPPLLAVLGSVETLQKPCVAMVGSRNASAAGQKIAGRLAREFGQAGFVVVSGLARGIDTSAHEASIETGTIAVLAGGLDHVYPAENQPLLRRLLEQGCAVTEMPLGWVPRGRDFPRRNRLVSGISLGTVVVEAARKSGSLITARFAGEQGREVFAVPGSPLDPRSEGCNHLIREGASLIYESEHVIEALTPLLRREDGFGAGARPWDNEEAPDTHALWDELALPGLAPAPSADFSSNADPAPYMAAAENGDASSESAVRAGLIDLLGAAPVSMDDLVRSSGHSARDVSRLVLELELAGEIQRQPGGLLVRVFG